MYTQYANANYVWYTLVRSSFPKSDERKHMARRRYLSTKVSVDKAVNRLAALGGDFAVMLYLMMIPHAEDDTSLTGDPEELKATVLPMRNDKNVADIVAALEAMAHHDIDLIRWNRQHSRVFFPPSSFYKYQTYIGAANRCHDAEAQFVANSPTPRNAEEHRETPKNTEDQRASAENTVSPSPSLSHSPSPFFVADATANVPDDESAGTERPKRSGKPTVAALKEAAIRELYIAFRRGRFPGCPASFHEAVPAGEFKTVKRILETMHADSVTADDMYTATDAAMTRWTRKEMVTVLSVNRQWSALTQPLPPVTANGSSYTNGHVAPAADVGYLDDPQLPLPKNGKHTLSHCRFDGTPSRSEVLATGGEPVWGDYPISVYHGYSTPTTMHPVPGWQCTDSLWYKPGPGGYNDAPVPCDKYGADLPRMSPEHQLIADEEARQNNAEAC